MGGGEEARRGHWVGVGVEYGFENCHATFSKTIPMIAISKIIVSAAAEVPVFTWSQCIPKLMQNTSCCLEWSGYPFRTDINCNRLTSKPLVLAQQTRRIHVLETGLLHEI